MKKYLKWIILCLCIFIFAIFTYKIVTDKVIYVDYLYDFISDNIINDKLTSIIKVITNLSSVIFIIVIATIAIIFIRNKRIKLLLASNLICITIINNLLKVIVARDRPNINRLVNENGYSFPSGHSITSMVFYGYLIYLIYRYVDNKNINISSQSNRITTYIYKSFNPTIQYSFNSSTIKTTSRRINYHYIFYYFINITSLLTNKRNILNIINTLI